MASIAGRRWATGLPLALGALLLWGIPVAAITPPNHEEPFLAGDYGVHTLIDSGEPYYGATCRYEAGQLVGFGIRRPIALAEGTPQYIGWQYRIEGTDDPDPKNATWEARFTSTLQKRFAADKQPAPFTPKSKDLSGLTHTWYRVVVRIFWYRPASTVDGRAFIAVESYLFDDGPSSSTDACPSSETSVASVPPDPEEKYVWGTYGVNILIDETDDWAFSGATCRYASGQLDRISIRRPIAFPSGQKQYVAWRYRIEGTDDPDLFNANWHGVATGPLEKVWTTPPQPAPFLPEPYRVTGSLDWDVYRVVVRVFWYKPAPTVVGKSFMAIESYDDGPNTDEADSFVLGCPAQHP